MAYKKKMIKFVEIKHQITGERIRIPNALLTCSKCSSEAKIEAVGEYVIGLRCTNGCCHAGWGFEYRK